MRSLGRRFVAESFTTTDLKTRPKLREDIAFSNISAVNLSVGSPTLHKVTLVPTARTLQYRIYSNKRTTSN